MQPADLGIAQGIRGLTTALLYGALIASAAASQAVEWKENLYNPKPLEDDIILPLPCGGAMAFRPAGTAAIGLLDDATIELGSESPATGHVEHRYRAHLAGSFEAPQTDQRIVLIGKYEVTALQFDAVNAEAIGETCPSPAPAGRLPKTRISWHDAITFTHRYSLWLRQAATDYPKCWQEQSPCVPRVDGEPAFVRLPTEIEWEYAARGADQVSPAEFREPRFPITEPLAAYAWFTENARGKIRPIGLKRPNPAGLHDVLGNAEEIVLEPFRLHRLDRPHGQTGGSIVRGGSFHATSSDLRTSLRREVPLYDDRGAVATADTGMRVVLASPVLTSAPRIQAIQAAWQALGTDVPEVAAESDPTPSEPEAQEPAAPAVAAPEIHTPQPEAPGPEMPTLDSPPQDDPVMELTELAQASPESDFKQRLERLRRLVATRSQNLLEQRARSAREALRFGGVLCQKLRDEAHNVALLKRRRDICIEGSDGDNPRCLRLQEMLERDEEVLEGNTTFYADSIIRTVNTYPDDPLVLDEQLKGLEQEFEARDYGSLAMFPRLFRAQAAAYAQNGRVEREHWRASCKDLQ